MVSEGTVSAKDAASFTGFGKRTIYDAMRDGVLPYVSRGKRRVIPKKALLQFLADRLVLR